MEEKKDNFRHILRIVATDLVGDKKIINEIRKIKGVSFMFANAVCNMTGVDKNKKAGYLTDAEISSLEEVLRNPLKFNIPLWMINRRIDPETGESKHLIGSDLKFITESDIRLMKKIRSYKGVRHSFGLPVRGQRTKSNFRRNKGKVAGVHKSKAPQASAKPKDAKEEKKK